MSFIFDALGPCHTFSASWIGFQIDAPVIGERMSVGCMLSLYQYQLNLCVESDG
jgi:hypothetical protein